jgi:hypothetical protein
MTVKLESILDSPLALALFFAVSTRTYTALCDCVKTVGVRFGADMNSYGEQILGLFELAVY